jgi:alkylmercury lyase
MTHHSSSLETLAERLSELLCGQQEDLCLSIAQQIVLGAPVEPKNLARLLQVKPGEMEQRLSCLPDTEYDQHGKIVGWGLTLLPTRHRLQIDEKTFWTWCAFDTLLFPPFLQVVARIHSACPISNRPVTFTTTNGEVKALSPSHAVMSLIVPTSLQECTRGTFCQQSLFFASEQAAAPFLAEHPEALLLSVEEAASVGKLVAQIRLQRATVRISERNGGKSDVR